MIAFDALKEHRGRVAMVDGAFDPSSHTFICEGVTIEDEVFVGYGVMFIDDRHRGTGDACR